MDFLYPVDFDREVLYEFQDEFEWTRQELEGVIVSLEKSPKSIELLVGIERRLGDVQESSFKLNLIPLFESLGDTVRLLNKILILELYPHAMSEFLLLVLDRISLLIANIEIHKTIDIRKTQNILTAIQTILLAPREGMEEATFRAIKIITREFYQNLELNQDKDDGILLFDDDNTTECPDAIEANPPAQSGTFFNGFTMQRAENPVIAAQEMISDFKKHNGVVILSSLSDLAVTHENSHSYVLLELAFAINMMAGEPFDYEDLFYGVCIHDIGLATMPEIISKTEKLTKEDFDKIKTHPTIGANVGRLISTSEVVSNIALHHHERIDGKGYPDGLKGDQISEEGKLINIIDSFHAMVDRQSYKMYAKSYLRAVTEINACVGTRYDKFWVKLFNLCFKKYWLQEHKEQLKMRKQTLIH